MPTPRTAGRLAVLLLAVPLVLAGCGDDEPAPVDTGAGKTFVDGTGRDEVVVAVRDNAFVAPYLTVSAGTTITFENRGRNQHDVVPSEEGAFAEVPTDELQPGTSADVSFEEPGTYPYYCSLHGTKTAGMVGTIRVVD
jgi:plastocyanin